MDGLLVELTRTKGSTLRLTLEIDGVAADQGYPKDVVDTVKANAQDLKLDKRTTGSNRTERGQTETGVEVHNSLDAT